MNKSKPIVFFGSGPVAAESLHLLHDDFLIEAVITKPRAPHHHGQVPVLELASKLGLKTYTVSNKEELDELFEGKPVHSDLAILIDFGIIVSQKVIDYFPLGIVNSHFSVLPQWRGADPITFSILSGQKQTGISLMLLVAAMDEGPLLGYGEYDLPADITTPELTDHLIHLSHALLLHNVPQYIEHRKAVPQNTTGREVSYSRKLTKKDGIIDWQKPASIIEREVRAFIEWPKSRTNLKGLDVVITKTHILDVKGTPGVASIINKQLVVACGQNSLVIDSLKPASKKEMTGPSFLAGHSSLFK